MENDNNIMSASGYIVIFSFVSVVFLFITLLVLGGFNNYVLDKLLSFMNSFIANGLIPTEFGVTAVSTSESLRTVMFYLDYVWFGSFISLIIGSLIFSYNRKRENYFSLLSMATLGIIIFVYFGGFIIQLTTWFQVEILLAVFPTFSSQAPIFNWYLNNLGIINLVLISVNILANFIDLDFSKFNKRKEGESLNEI